MITLNEVLLMKKASNAILTLLFLIIVVSGALAADKTIKPVVKTVENYIAVFDFEVTTGDKRISRPLTESVRREIVLSGKYDVIDRGNMNKILGEQKFQLTGCVAQECIVDAGQCGLVSLFTNCIVSPAFIVIWFGENPENAMSTVFTPDVTGCCPVVCCSWTFMGRSCVSAHPAIKNAVSIAIARINALFFIN